MESPTGTPSIEAFVQHTNVSIPRSPMERRAKTLMGFALLTHLYVRAGPSCMGMASAGIMTVVMILQ